MSCGNFLNETPQGVVTSDNFFKTGKDAIAATTAVYDVLGWYNSQEVFEWFLGDICSDDAEKGGENAGDWAELQLLKEFRGSASNSILPPRYTEPYQGIHRANLVIQNVPGIAMDTTLRNRLVAEAKFLRGYFYFMLVKTFGKVPLVTHTLSPEEYCQARTGIDTCWMQIEKDFSEAAAVLPPKKAVTDAGRATSGAAKSFLVKAYMYQGKFGPAEKLAQEVINSGEYGLERNYEDIFTQDAENGIESIFEIQHIEVGTDNWGDDNEGQVTSVYQGGRNNTWFAGWGFNCPTPDFVAEFEPNDRRLKATVIFNGDVLYKGTPREQIADNSDSHTGMHARKYLLEYQEDEPEESNAPGNWRVMRYAELLLFHAEAANEMNNPTPALRSLNTVRARVGMLKVTTTDQDSLRNAIYHERRVELGLEGHRFYDLVRQGRGRALKVLGKNGFKTGKEYFPIPQIELDVCSKMTQNPY
jgi:hypothetical protein